MRQRREPVETVGALKAAWGRHTSSTKTLPKVAAEWLFGPGLKSDTGHEHRRLPSR